MRDVEQKFIEYHDHSSETTVSLSDVHIMDVPAYVRHGKGNAFWHTI